MLAGRGYRPAGQARDGAQNGVRAVMLGVAAGLACAVPAAGAQELPALPSGQALSLIEVIDEPAPAGGTWSRWRYLAPEIGKTLSFADIEADFAHLCQRHALPELAARGAAVEQIIISMADRKLEFGAADPDATQFFEAFRIEGQDCIWEGF